MNNIILVRSGGDLATGIIHRMHRCGFNVVVSELPDPLVIRREVAFASAVSRGTMTVEGVTARATNLDNWQSVAAAGEVPVVCEDYHTILRELKPAAVADATLRKQAADTNCDAAAIVIGIGPGFTVGVNVHAIVETMRGHNLGKVLLSGSALPNTGEPGNIAGYTHQRVLRAPVDGSLEVLLDICSQVKAGQPIARVGTVDILATLDGVVRGMIAPQQVCRGLKIADIDPRGIVEYCYSISEKARAIAGGAIEALLLLGHDNGQWI